MNIAPTPPSVACIIPCYNAASTIERSIQSVTEQTSSVSEIIVVDDGSSDGSIAMVEELARVNPKLTLLIHERNLGPSEARNTGWAATGCDWIAFLDSDDTWHPQKIEAQLVALRLDPKCDLLGHLSEVELAETSYPLLNLQPDAIRGVLKRISSREILWQNPFSTPTVLVRREIDLRFDPMQKHCEDYLFWIQASLSGYRVSRIELPLARLYKPRFGASGLSANMWAMEYGELRVYRRLLSDGRIGLHEWLAASGWSLAKYARRRLIVR